MIVQSLSNNLFCPGFLKRPAISRGINNTPSILPSQNRLLTPLFGATKFDTTRFGATGAPINEADKARYLARQQQAEARRNALPAIVQLHYPVLGSKIGIRQMEALEQAIAAEGLFNGSLSSLPGSQEFKAREYFFFTRLALLNRLFKAPETKKTAEAPQTLDLEALDPAVFETEGFDTEALETDRFSSAALLDELFDRCAQYPNSCMRRGIAKAAGDLKDPNLIASFIEKFHDERDFSVRRNAAQAVKHINDSTLLMEALKRFLEDDDYNVRGDAAEAAGSIADPDLRDALLVGLSQRPELQVKSAVAKVANTMTDPKLLVEVIDRLLENPSPDLAREAAQAAGSISDPELRDSTLERLSKSRNHFIKEGAAYNVGLISDPELRDSVMTRLCKDDRREVKKAAAQSAAHISDPEVRDATIKRLSEHPDEPVRAGAAVATVSISDPELKHSTIDRLSKDPDFLVRGEAALAAAHISDLELRDATIKRCANDPAWFVRSKAALAAPGINDLESQRSVITQLAKDSDINVKKAITETACNISDQTLLVEVIEILSQDKSYEGNGISKAIDRIEDPRLRDSVILRLADSRVPYIREQAILVGDTLSQSELQDAVIEKFFDPDLFTVRVPAARTITRMLLVVIHRFLSDYPEYIPLLKESVTGCVDYSALASGNPDPAGDNARLPRLDVNDTLGILATLSATHRDAGEFKTQVLPQYQNLLAFAKTESNKHLHPGQEAYSEADIEAAFNKHADRILKLLVIAGEQPLRFNLTQGLDKFTRFLKTAKGLYHQPEPLYFLRTIVQRKDIPPYEVTQILEIAASFCKLGETKTLIETLRQIVSEQTIEAPTLLRDLGRQYLETFARVCGLNAQVNSESLPLWNLSYMNVLAEAYRGFDEDSKEALKGIVEATLGNRFEAYLRDPDSDLGKANSETATLYQQHGLDIQQWLNYPTTQAFTLGASDESDQSTGHTALDNLTADFARDLIQLIGSRKQGIQPLVDNDSRKLFFTFIKRQGYGFDENLQLTSTSPNGLTQEALTQLAEQLLKFLDEKGVWQAAESNGQNEILTIRSHLEQLKNDFQTLSSEKAGGKNFLIKTWERNPGYDLFQGNYSQCCIALNQANRSAIVDYLTHHAVQIVEIKDLQKDKTIANTFLYWAKDKSGQRYLVADNVEVAAQYRDDETTCAIRDELTAYLKQYARQVAGADVPVLLGKRYNGIPVKDLTKAPMTLQFIGKTDEDQLYLDSLKGGDWSNIALPHTAKFYRLNA